MKVFMLGWEFPPFISGGLGTACYGLTRAMDQLGDEFDLKEFHRVVLSNGSMPLDVLEKVVERYIEEKSK